MPDELISQSHLFEAMAILSTWDDTGVTDNLVREIAGQARNDKKTCNDKKACDNEKAGNNDEIQGTDITLCCFHVIAGLLRNL